MDFDQLFDRAENAMELGKDPKKVVVRNTLKSYVKYGFGTAVAAPAALGLVLADQPVIAKPITYSEMRDATLVSSITASQTLSLDSNIVVTTSTDNVTIGGNEHPWVFTSLFR